MFANGCFRQMFDSLTAQPPGANPEPQQRPGPPLPNGDNGELTKDSRLGPPLPNGDNGETTTDSMAAPQHPGPPLPNRYLTVITVN
jgi:hypothetical protein